MSIQTRKFDASAVFFTALATLFGAILFLRFGYAIGTVGLWGVYILIPIASIVTIPTALAISEISTNKRVEGGGEYFIISRSFGLNIGGTLGIMLYFSQTISVAFYIVAFTETFSFFFDYIAANYGIALPRQVISLPVMLLLSALVIFKGANSGMKTLYLVVSVLIVSLIFFFLGSPVDGSTTAANFTSNAKLLNQDQMFLVFAIIFPAFIGMTAGVGLSGDLKDPGKAIPRGTISATILSFIIYFFIAYKLAISAPNERLLGDQLVMVDIAVFGSIIILLGLAASTFSSALGSVMVGPRTLQAMALDKSIPIPSANRWLGKSREKDDEPVNASIVTCAIAFIFVAIGSVDIIAQIITLFFLVTYGTLCLISFLNHFGSSPSYRPTFKSKWYISLIGFLAAGWVMIQISVTYTFIAIAVIILLYVFMVNYHKKKGNDRNDFSTLFANALFQLNRNLQIFIQKKRNKKNAKEDWRPSAICISMNTFERKNALKVIEWVSYNYGFGTYLHLIEGYYSTETCERADLELNKLISELGTSNHVYIDTIISPSTTSAIAQSIQIPGVSGMENNMVIFEYEKGNDKELYNIVDNYRMVAAGGFDVCIMASDKKPINYEHDIHIWVRSFDTENTNLMILLGFIISGHPDWKKANIRLFNICKKGEEESVTRKMEELIKTGRLAISFNNVEVIASDGSKPVKDIISEHSQEVGLTLMGFTDNNLRSNYQEFFRGYENMGNILFVCSNGMKDIV